MFQLGLSPAGTLARLCPAPLCPQGTAGWEGTPGDTHSPSTMVAQAGTGAADAPGLAGGTGWVTPCVSLRILLHLLKCLYVKPRRIFLPLLSLLSPPARIYFFFYKISVLRCQSQWTFSTDVSAFSFLPPSEMIVTIYRIRVIGAEGSNCCYISASEQFVFVPSKIFLEMFLSPQSNTASVPCHAMTYICTEDAR